MPLDMEFSLPIQQTGHTHVIRVIHMVHMMRKMHASCDASLSITNTSANTAVTKHVEALINGPLIMGSNAAHYLHQGFQHIAPPFASLQHVADHPRQTPAARLSVEGALCCSARTSSITL